MATHYFGPFALTNLLLPARLHAARAESLIVDCSDYCEGTWSSHFVSTDRTKTSQASSIAVRETRSGRKLQPPVACALYRPDRLSRRPAGDTQKRV
ncbi:hypothetical protein ACFVY1_35730 [Streptomyces sp. NPDC058293]|uniref:hypothetical protein n=1 Tax=Streptomyces sp. NPDC058293 TaxID=3346429 RepID=UPI0036E13A05